MPIYDNIITSPKDSPVPTIDVGISVNQNAILLFPFIFLLSKIKKRLIYPMAKYNVKKITLI